VKGLVFDIKRFAIHDGPGIRTTIFLKGCPLRCWWCHNPESQASTVQFVNKEIKLDGKIYTEKEQIGNLMTVEEVMNEIRKDMVFYEESDGGVTFSGGEPLMQSDFLIEIMELCKQEGIHTAIDTSGHTEPGNLKRIMKLADLFLFDLKMMNDITHLEYTGVSNELSLSNLKYLARENKDVIIRFPVIPGVTDENQNLDEIMIFMKNFRLNNIDLLPYHSIAKNKYMRLGLKYELSETEEPSEEQMEKLKMEFSKAGFQAVIGG